MISLNTKLIFVTSCLLPWVTSFFLSLGEEALTQAFATETILKGKCLFLELKYIFELLTWSSLSLEEPTSSFVGVLMNVVFSFYYAVELPVSNTF